VCQQGRKHHSGYTICCYRLTRIHTQIRDVLPMAWLMHCGGNGAIGVDIIMANTRHQLHHWQQHVKVATPLMSAMCP
jgi:hypothetical protein